MAVLVRRLRAGRRRGAALFDALLAITLLAVLGTGVLLWMGAQKQKDLIDEAGRQVAIWGHAAAHYARTHFAEDPGATGGPWSNSPQIMPTDLESRGILPADFPTTDAMRRELRIWFRHVPSGSFPTHDRIQVLAGQSNFAASNDTRLPYRALLRSRGKVRLGMVRRSGCPPGLTAPCLVGPTVAESLTPPFDVGWIEHGAVMAFYEITREEYCGDLVLREDTPTCPDSAVLGSLDMGAHTLENVGDLTVGAAGANAYTHEVGVHNDMEQVGNMTVDIVSGRGGLVVGRSVDVDNLTVNGGLAIYGNVEASNNLDISAGDFSIRGNLDVRGHVDAGNSRSATMRIDETANENLNTEILRTNNCPACTR